MAKVALSGGLVLTGKPGNPSGGQPRPSDPAVTRPPPVVGAPRHPARARRRPLCENLPVN